MFKIDNQLETLTIQYLADLRNLYFPSIYCTKDELRIKPLLSKCLKETLIEIRGCFSDEVSYRDLYESILYNRIQTTLKQDENYINSVILGESYV